MRLLLSRGGADPGSKLRRAAWKPFGGSFSLSIGRQEAWFDLSEVATDIGRARAKNLRGACGHVSAESSSSVIHLRFLRGIFGRSVDLGPQVVNHGGRSETSRRGPPLP